MAKKTSAQLQRDIDEVLQSKPGKPSAKRANDQLYDLVNNKYFTAIPLDQIFDIVEGAGFHFDADEKQVILTGRDGKASWDLYDRPGHLAKHMLVLQWHKMDVTGRYEVVAYVS